MPTQPYFLKSGKKCPGNTSVIGSNLGWKTGGLVHWAWALGMKGLDYRKVRDEQAGIGTLVMARIEAELHHRPLPDEAWFWDWITDEKALKDAEEKIQHSMLAFWEWRDTVSLQVTGSEEPLVCECYQYGTTLDLLALVKGRRRIVEIKTANYIYPDYWIQMAAQGHAWNCNHPEDPTTGYDLLHIGKENGGFAHHYRPSLDKAFEAFLALRKLHDLKRELK